MIGCSHAETGRAEGVPRRWYASPVRRTGWRPGESPGRDRPPPTRTSRGPRGLGSGPQTPDESRPTLRTRGAHLLSERQTGQDRVVVVGAGLSGLAAAYRLVERARAARRAVEVVVVDAKDRVG